MSAEYGQTTHSENKDIEFLFSFECKNHNEDKEYNIDFSDSPFLDLCEQEQKVIGYICKNLGAQEKSPLSELLHKRATERLADIVEKNFNDTIPSIGYISSLYNKKEEGKADE